jgi:Uma2 family endonuclease
MAMPLVLTPRDLDPPFGEPFTIADLEKMPNDGRRYELLNGVLLVSPAPQWRHQEAQLELAIQLRQACPKDMRVITAPFAVRPSDDKTELQPDILVARYEDLTQPCLPTAPLLAVEVLSPSTALIDMNLKKVAYERLGTPYYWVVDPVEPGIYIFEADEQGKYQQVATAVGDEPCHIEHPFPLTVVPNSLIAGLE